MSAVFADVDAIIGKLFEMNNSNMALQSEHLFLQSMVLAKKQT